MTTSIYKYNLILSIFFILAGTATAQTHVSNQDVYTGQTDITASTQVKLLPGFRAVAGSKVHAYIDAGANYTSNNYTIPAPGTMNTFTPTSGNNYVWTTVLRGATNTEAGISSQLRTESVQYVDGLGRPLQSIIVQGSPLKKDIVQTLAYDDFGRQNKNYLPYVAGTATGAFVTDAKTDCINYYKGNIPGRAQLDQNPDPWNETLYEASPLNRVEEGKGPDAWQNKPVTVSYSTNSGTIQHWNANKASINFTASQLYITTRTDEDLHQTREYKDKLGRVVRKEAHDGTNWLRTAYVYNDFGQLVIVVPPKATAATQTELCYYYEYDERKRMIKKDLPGAAPVYMVYDKRDRLVMVQDGEMDANNQWLATVYDNLNRPVLTALISKDVSPSVVKTAFSGGVVNASYSTSGAYFDYSVTMPSGYGISENTIQTVNYYDDKTYAFINEFTAGNEYDYTSPYLAGNPDAASVKTKGLVTGTLTRAIINGNDVITDQLLLTVSYYDDFGRPIRTISDNHMGGQDVVYTNYNFAGQPTESITRHNASGAAQDIKLASTFAYDHQGRLLSEKMEINDNGNAITICANKYNELGEVIEKYLHGDASGNNFNQQLDYVYNVKGWLNTINTVGTLNNDLFALDLRYNNPGSDDLTAPAVYNGNIAEMRWDVGTPKGYGFTYDGANRLTASDYADGSSFTSNDNKYNTSYGYDTNGNIDNLTRSLNGNAIDDLTYTYPTASNQLQSVNDVVAGDNGKLGYDDNNGTYFYDSNGNLIGDPSKGTDIEYNHLNLPAEVKFGTDDFVRYTYDASGNKLKKVVEVDGVTTSGGTDYVGNFIYENGDLKAIFTSEGRIIPISNGSETVFKFEYNLKDHLGNTRVAFGGHTGGQPEIIQTTDYYPFGMVMNQTNSFADGVLANKYLYNGKELQDDELAGVKLDWYDYGARFYDPALGRWHSVDPSAENYLDWTPYNYCANNPILLVDLDGRDWFYYNQEGQEEASWNWHDGDTYEHQYITYSEGGDEQTNYIDLKGVDAVVVFEGSLGERLGTESDHSAGDKNKSNQYLKESSTFTAGVTVYGPDGKDDVSTYTGYTMSSNSDKFGVVAEGIHDGIFVTPGKSGSLKSNWKLKGNVPAMNGQNPAHPERSPGFLNGVYIHSVNSNGWAGTWNSNGRTNGVSEGCLLIARPQWNNFKKQLSGAKQFKVQLKRLLHE